MVQRITRYTVVLTLLAILGVFSLGHTEALPVYLYTDTSFTMHILEAVRVPQPTEARSARAVIVPHHLVAAPSIAYGISRLASTTQTIILISPDHFFRCPARACTTDGTFLSAFGTTTTDQVKTRGLFFPVVLSPDLFTREHGIFTITPFISHYLPDARIIPIVLSTRGVGTRAERLQLTEVLAPYMIDEHTAIVTSSDFSHYKDLIEADSIDRDTIRTLQSNDIDALLRLRNPTASDCPLCLWVTKTLLEHRGTTTLSIEGHTNSARLMNEPDAKETTSHLIVIFSEE